MTIRLLEKISDVQVGDYLSASGTSGTPQLGIVDEVNEIYFSYRQGTSLSAVTKSLLPGIILLRKTQGDLEILAGRDVYKKLTGTELSK